MEITVTDNLFLKTPEGLVRPSDADGEYILCDDGRYRQCFTEPELMREPWRLYLSNGMILELNDGTCVKDGLTKWLSLNDLKIGSPIYSEGLPKANPNPSELRLPYEDLGVNYMDGTFDIGNENFAALAGSFVTTGRKYKEGLVTIRRYRDKLGTTGNALSWYGVDFKRLSYTYEIPPCYLTKILEELFGIRTTRGVGRHSIPDFIIENASTEWVEAFIKGVMGGYTPSQCPGNTTGYNFGDDTALLVNDIAHLLQGHTKHYSFTQARTGDPTVIKHLMFFDIHDFKSGYKPEVHLLQGLKDSVKTVGRTLHVEGDVGIYFSGFYIK